MDTDREVEEESKEPIGSKEGADRQMSPGEGNEANPHTDRCRCSQNWKAIMEESEGLAYDDPPLQLRCYCHGGGQPARPSIVFT